MFYSIIYNIFIIQVIIYKFFQKFHFLIEICSVCGKSGELTFYGEQIKSKGLTFGGLRPQTPRDVIKQKNLVISKSQALFFLFSLSSPLPFPSFLLCPL